MASLKIGDAAVDNQAAVDRLERSEREMMLGNLLMERVASNQTGQIGRIRELLVEEEARQRARHQAVKPGEKMSRERLSSEQMAARLDEDTELGLKSKYVRCTNGCGIAYSIKNKHSGCKIRNAIADAHTDAEMGESKQVLISEIRNQKQSLSGALTHKIGKTGKTDRYHQRMQEYVQHRLQNFVEQSHRLRYFAGPMVNAYLGETMNHHGVDISRIQDYMPSPETGEYDQQACKMGPLVTLVNDSFKMAMVACAKENNRLDAKVYRSKSKKPSDSAILKFCQEKFLVGDNIPNIRNALGSLEHITSSGALQALATQWQTNHEQMMSVLIWSRTKYWVRMQLDRITQTIELFKKQKPVLMKPIRAWISRYITNAGNFEWITSQSDAQIQKHFMSQVCKTSTAEAERQLEEGISYGDLWDAMWQQCFQSIVRILMPLEMAAQGTHITISKQKGNAFRQKTMNPSICAAYRCTWVYAIGNWIQRENLSNPATKLSLTHLTPQVGLKPGHILVDGYLMRHIWNDFQFELHPAQKRVSTAPDSIDWHKFFRFPETFWFNALHRSSCSTFMTDGMSVSFQKERMILTSIRNLERIHKKDASTVVTKKKTMCKPTKKRNAPSVAADGAQPPPPVVRNIDHLHYIEQETLESLKAKHIVGVFTIDGNRKNMFVGMYRPLEQMLQEPQESARGTSDIIPFHVKVQVSKKRFKVMRRIVHADRVRKNMYQVKFPHGGHENWMTPPSLKGSTLDQFKAWRMWCETDDRVNELLNFFSLHTFRRLCLESYAAQRKMWPSIHDTIYELVAASIIREKQRLISTGHQADADHLLVPVNSRSGFIQKQKNQAPLSACTDPRMLVVLGDGSFRHNSAGHVTMPTGKKMFDEMKKVGEHICWVDEYRTSKCCSSCGEDTVDVILEKKAPIPRTSIRNARRPREATARQLFHADRHDRLRKEALTRAETKIARAEAGVERHMSAFPKRRHRRAHGHVLRSELCRQHNSKAHLPSNDIVSNTIAPWGLRACVSPQCCRNNGGARLWCRDTNACINMLKRTSYWLVYNLVGPDYLLRSTDPLYLSKRSRT